MIAQLSLMSEMGCVLSPVAAEVDLLSSVGVIQELRGPNILILPNLLVTPYSGATEEK